MIIEIVIALLAGPLIYFIGIYINHLWNLSKYPNGPFPLPVFGNIHILGTKSYKVLKELSKKYGDVYSISLGMERVVIVNTIEAVNDGLVEKGVDFVGRPQNAYLLKFVTREFSGIGLQDYNKKWISMRKIAHQSLRLFGDGLKKIESYVLEECEDLEKSLKATEGTPIDIHYDLGLSVLNIICNMVFGKRYKKDDEEFLLALNFSNMIMTSFTNGDPVVFLPWLRFLPSTTLKQLQDGIKIRDPFLRKQVLQHMKDLDPKNLKDFTDSLLVLAENEEQCIANGVGKLTIDNIEMIISDLFIAGIDTTSTTLNWACVYLLHWPEYQDKIYQEILNVVGKDNTIKLEDRKNLHFTQATIYETLRLSSIAPLLAHKATKDSSIAGVKIQKGTQVMFNLWACHHDEKHWENPNKFNPYRWLNEDGKFDSSRNMSILPFSAGRRVCIGEVKAKIELFLFLTRLVSKFEILPDPDADLPSITDCLFGLILAPYPFKVVLKSRK